jgi:putative transposase
LFVVLPVIAPPSQELEPPTNPERFNRTHGLPLVRQAALLRLSRSSLYYEPQPVPEAELAIMRRIDALHLDYPFAGSRMLRDLLRGEGINIGRERVRTMMRRMCIEALYRRPNTSKPCPGHKIYPYLLRGLVVERANQVWSMDITYIPMARGFVYLAAVVDWFSRRVLAWRISITMEVDFCLEAVEEALARYGKPAIFNTDQGSQFTSAPFTGLLLKNGIAISMDGKGAWRDNVFVERLWRSVKHEEVYLRAYETVAEARRLIGWYLDFFNSKRPHSSLGARTPDDAYFNPLTPLPIAA